MSDEAPELDHEPVAAEAAPETTPEAAAEQQLPVKRKNMPPRKLPPSHEKLRTVLNQVCIDPQIKPTLRALAGQGVHVHPTTLYNWLERSRNGDPHFLLNWMGADRQFFQHYEVARKLTTVALDMNTRSLAIHGHRSPKFAKDGSPVWRVDPKLASDAMDPGVWEMLHAPRPITDIFERDERGALIQEIEISPPNPQLLVKVLAQLAPDVYGNQPLEVHHKYSGYVWVAGEKEPGKVIDAKPGEDFHAEFGLVDKKQAGERPTNVLAIPAPCKDAAEFDARFRAKLVREVALFRDADGKLERPLPDDIIVEGSYQDKAFTEAGIEHATVSPVKLLEEGYQNPFLKRLALQSGQWGFADTPTEPNVIVTETETETVVEVVDDDPPEMVGDTRVVAEPVTPLRKELEARLAARTGAARPPDPQLPTAQKFSADDPVEDAIEAARASLARPVPSPPRDPMLGIPATPIGDRATVGRNERAAKGGYVPPQWKE